MLRLVILAGLPTTGKTALGASLAEATRVRFLDVDESATACFGPPVSGPYATEEGKARDRNRMMGAYKLLSVAADFYLRRGDSLIVAATFSRPEYWEQLFLPLLDRHPGIRPCVVLSVIPDSQEGLAVTERLGRSDYRGGCKDIEHYRADKNRYAAPPAALNQITLDRTIPLEKCLRIVREFVGV